MLFEISEIFFELYGLLFLERYNFLSFIESSFLKKKKSQKWRTSFIKIKVTYNFIHFSKLLSYRMIKSIELTINYRRFVFSTKITCIHMYSNNIFNPCKI